METTPRLRIESLCEEHAFDTYDKLQAEEIYTYIPETPPATVDALAKHYARLSKGSSVASEQWLNWVLVIKETNEIIGTLQSTLMIDEGIAYIAYVLFPEYWGNGYATEGTSWLMDSLETADGIHTVVAEIDTRNKKSIKLAEKNGFKKSKTVPTEEGEDHIYIKPI